MNKFENSLKLIEKPTKTIPACNGREPIFEINSFKLSFSTIPKTKPKPKEKIGFWKKATNIIKIAINNLYIL